LLPSRITEGENRHFKTNLKTNTDHHNGDLNVRFTHFKWSTFKV